MFDFPRGISPIGQFTFDATIVGVVLLYLALVLWPIALWSLARNVKRVRREFERLNELLDSRLSADHQRR